MSGAAFGAGRRPLDPGALERDARAARERWSVVDAAVARLRVERGSPGGEVRVTVDGQGQLVDVRFSERTRTTTPDRLAAMLLDALRRAQAALADEVGAAVERAGAARDGETARAMLDGYRRRFPPVGDDSPRSRARPARRHHVVAVSAPGFAADETGLRRRGDAVAAVEVTLRRAAAATADAGSPEAYGLLCSFFPALLDPVQQQAREALGRAADTCRATVGDLGSAETAFTGTDDAGAAALRGPRR